MQQLYVKYFFLFGYISRSNSENYSCINVVYDRLESVTINNVSQLISETNVEVYKRNNVCNEINYVLLCVYVYIRASVYIKADVNDLRLEARL